MRVLLNTNVLVSAFTTRGLCADVLRLVIAEHELSVAAVVRDELRRVLSGRFKVPADAVADIVSLLEGFEVIAMPKKISGPKVRDPDDAWVLASALAGKAEVLVSGDRDLLALPRLPTLRILDPRGFWESMRSSTPPRQ